MDRVLLAAALVLVVAVGGCGSSDEQASTDNKCIVTFSGSELCGESARGWCTKFANRLDEETRQACNAVGAEFPGPVADSDPIAVSQKVSDELFEGFSEYSPSAGYEDGRYR